MKKELSKQLLKIANVLEKFAKGKKKKPKSKGQGLNLSQWKRRLKKMNAPDKVIDSFVGRWKGAEEYAKGQGWKRERIDEYVARTAIDKLPKKYLVEPTEHHGPKKTGPIKK